MQQYCKKSFTFATMFQIYKIILRIAFLFLFGLANQLLYAQTLEGIVRDENTKAPIQFAHIYAVELSAGTLSDTTGKFYFQNFPSSLVNLKISVIGYSQTSISVTYVSGTQLEIFLKPEHIHLDEVVVSTPFGKLQNESVTNVETRKISELNRIPSTTLSEALGTIPGVYISSTGTGIGKPVIRGLSGTRVVTYLNGLRIENQQWGDDHGMGITDIGIESVEVIKGPASLLYGSDALGGVMYFVNQPYAKLNRFEGYFQTRFESNTMGSISELGLKWNRNGFKFNVFAGQSVHANYQLPNGNRVHDSRFSSSTIKSSIGYNKKNWVGNLHYSFFQSYVGIPGDTDEDSVYTELFYTKKIDWNKTLPHQNITNNFFSFENKLYFSKSQLELILGNTNNQLREIEDSTFVPGLNLSLNNSIYNLRWKTELTKNFEAIFGSQGMYQINTNAADAEDILIPDNHSVDVGAYAVLEVELKKWTLQGGARFDNRTISTKTDFNGFGIFNESYQSYNYAIGFCFVTDSINLRFNLSSGFRAPHTSELLSNGVHHGTFRYNLGDPKLNTENALQADFSIGAHYDHLEITFNPFFNQINNYIFLNPTDSIIEGYQVFQYSQTNKAQLFGGDLSLHMHPHFAHWLHIQSSFSYIYAQDQAGNPLPLIPQTRINSQLKFELHSHRKFKISDIVIQHSLYLKQDRIGAFETQTPAYNLIHLGINMSIETKGQPIYLTIGAKNILNENYFDHLSSLKQIGLQHPGINGYVGLKFNLEKKIGRK